MTTDTKFRLAFWILLFSALAVFGRALLAQPPPIEVRVSPKVATVNPYKRTGFRFTWVIEPHADNRQYALSYSCGSEVHSSQGPVDGDQHPRTRERYVELTVKEDCSFMACVVRVVNGKPKTLCAWATVSTPKGEP